MASMSYLLKFISVLARQNLSPGTATMQCHLETGHTKMIPNFRSIFWSLKDQNKDFDFEWFIFKKSSGYNTLSKSCNLCLLEKLIMCNFKEKMEKREKQLLNKQLNLVSKCRHENKYKLINYSGID